MQALSFGVAALVLGCSWQAAADPPAKPAHPHGAAAGAAEEPAPRLLDEAAQSRGTVTVAGRTLVYGAEAGVLVVHSEDLQDADPPPAAAHGEAAVPAEASLSYVAYTLGAEPDPRRPITFLFNGGPGSASVWLHLGGFGPKRVLTLDHHHTPPAPYQLVDNPDTLLPESDLVFIDAPGTGFGRLRGDDKEQAFYGVDADVRAFARFIVEFLSRHGRWNSPKYLFGESYGTVRAAALAYQLANEHGVDLNGVMLLGQNLNYDDNLDEPELAPSNDLPYALLLPSYAATAWYHHRLADPPATLEPLLREVESYALGEYLTALAAGNELGPERRAAVAARLHAYTGLETRYIERANLRIAPLVFEQHVLGAERTVGRYDSRFEGPALDPLSKGAEYDPQDAGTSSAYVSAFNDYVRRELKFGAGRTYKHSIDVEKTWDYLHQPPGASGRIAQAVNVLPDLAAAMKRNPHLHLQMHAGYFDLATPYFAAEYELRHLQVPPAVAANVERWLYPAGHMVYEAEPAALHAHAADFIRRTHSGAGH